MAIFQKSVIKKHLNNLDKEHLDKAYRIFKENYSPSKSEKINKKVNVFYEYDFNAFVTELKKQKVRLSLVQQDEWEEHFASYKDEINPLQDEINTTDKEIDQMVYELYDLTEEEIKIVEESLN